VNESAGIPNHIPSDRPNPTRISGCRLGGHQNSKLENPMPADVIQLSQSLQARCGLVASEWHRAIAVTSFVPFNSAQVHQQLRDLACKVAAILASEPFDPAPAQTVGHALVQLHYLQPESLQDTLVVLGAQFMDGLSADQRDWLQPRLLAALGWVAHGFVIKMRQLLLEEQEQIRRALEFERQQAEEEIRTLNKTLVRRVVERTEQLEIANQDLEREVAVRKRILETLQDTTQALQTLIQASPLAITATDVFGNVRIWNPAAEKMFGWTAAEIVGQPLPIVPADWRDEYLALRQAAPREGYSSVEGCRQRKDGGLINVSISSSRLFDSRGELTGYMSIIADITARKQSEAMLRQYAAQLEARNQELNVFAGAVAHDLQNPLAIIVGRVGVLQLYYDTLPDEARRECADIIARSAQKMNSIIRELLVLAGVIQEQIQIKPLDLAFVVAQACQQLAYLIEQEHADIILPQTLWPEALGYAPWIEEVWVNYIGNAIKYGSLPGAAPRVELGGRAEPDGRVRLWVRDYGPGLTADQQQRLFQPFTQLNQVRAKGHGLGLSIVRFIVEKLGGQVGVESSGLPGEGCLFYFTLPGRRP
jgi:PAS domain S-box-containing protein